MIVVFPGQGSQTPGMGKDIYDNFASARDVFHEVDDAVSFSLSKLIFEGSEDDLKATEHTQPALLAVSMAFVSVLKTEFGFDVCERAKFFAGHSLGEYTALCAAGSISLCDAARTLKLRGKAMAEAYPIDGAMAAIFGMETDALTPIVAELSSPGAIVQIANDNSFGQIVISGHADAVKKATQVAVERGAKKTRFSTILA